MKKISFLKSTILWIIAIIVFSMVLKPHRTVNTEAFDGKIRIQGYSGYTMDVAYDEIESVELQKNFDYGIPVDGTDEKKEKSGIWKNAMFGEYQLCVNTAIDTCIILHMTSGVLVMNYESEKSTESLYEAILKQQRN